MNTPDLAALVPGQMARHPSFEWTILSGWVPEEDLVVELHPRGWPERVATVQVNSGAEVFSFTFAGHVSHGFAYEDQDRSETLQERIDLAAEAAGGPTRVIRDCRGGITVRSTLVVDPDGPHPRPNVVSYPLRRLKSLFRADRGTREVDDFPATRCSQQSRLLCASARSSAIRSVTVDVRASVQSARGSPPEAGVQHAHELPHAAATVWRVG